MKSMNVLFSLVLFCCFMNTTKAQEIGSATVLLRAPYYTSEDTLILRVLDTYYFGSVYRNPYKEIKMASKTGDYMFFVDSVSRLSRIYLYKQGEVLFGDMPAMPLLGEYFLNPGDSIQIFATSKKGWTNSGTGMANGKVPYKDFVGLKFSGKGSEKFNAKWTIDSLEGTKYQYGNMHFLRQTKAPYFSDDLSDVEYAKDWWRHSNSFRWNIIFSALQLYRLYLDEDVYWQMYADYLGEFYGHLNYRMRPGFYSSENSDSWKRTRNNFIDNYMKIEGEDIPLKYRRNSPSYQGYLAYWLDNFYSLDYYGKGTYKTKYDLIKDKAPLGFRDELLTDEVVDVFGRNADLRILEDALKIIKDPYLLKQLEGLDQLDVGKPAAKFELLDQHDKKISSDQFKGKVVFMDFWFLSCASCKTYLKNVLKPVFEKYKNDKRIVFVTVAAEPKAAFLKGLEWAVLHGSNAYDLYTGSLTFNHPLIQHYKIKGYPHPMIIGKDGNIFSRADKKLRNQNGLIAAIEEALAQQP